MNNYVLLRSLLTFLFVTSASAESPIWTPRIEFMLEDANYEQTLFWLSGFSYALTEVGHSAKAGICLTGDQVVDSRVLVDALNRKFKGKRITSEQAAPVLFAEAQSTFKCSK